MEVVTSGMILVAWVWLYTLLPKSAALTPEELQVMKGKMKKRMKTYAEDHHVVAWVLDHRLRGAGLTSTAHRKIREIAVQLFQKLFPGQNEKEFCKQWINYEHKEGMYCKMETTFI